MCGLVGVAGDTTARVKDVFDQLLLADAIRGMHSTGAAAVIQDPKDHNKVAIELCKRPGPSQMLVLNNEYQKMVRQGQVKMLIGHNRFATIGEHTISNAHPFAFENVVGAHNGTLDAYTLKRLHKGEDFGTDSEAIYSHLNEYKDPQKAVDVMRGAWALTWYDKRDHTLNFLRNDKRPLFYAYSKDRCTIFWASEKDMLDWVLKRNNVEKFNDEFYLVEVDKHLKWEIPATINGKFDAPEMVECKVPILPPAVVYERPNYYGSGGAYNWDGQSYRQGYRGDPLDLRNTHGTGGTTTGQTTGKAPWEPLFNQDISKFRPPYKDAYGKTMNKLQFNELVATGCVFCDRAESKWGDFILPLKNDLDGRKIYLCGECYEEPEIRELAKHASN